MWQKTPEELRYALTASFPNGDIEWRVSATNRDKTKGLAVPYVTNRAIQNRLDDTLGIDGWRNEFVPWKEGKAQLCGISIYFAQQKLWLTKWDGADDSDIESVKGGLSDSMKRAAVEWGIGRYLYGMTQVWVQIEQRGKGFVIVDSERYRLDQTHEDWMRRLSGKNTGAPPQGAAQRQAPQGRQDPPPAGAQQPNGQPGQQQYQQPPQAQRQQQSQQPGPQQPQPQRPQQQSQQQPPAPQGAEERRPRPQPSAPTGGPGLQEGFYLVRGAVLKPSLGGSYRTSVQLQDCAGQCFQAFTHGPDSSLAPGVILANAKLLSRNKDGVTFYILDDYTIVTYTAQAAA